MKGLIKLMSLTNNVSVVSNIFNIANSGGPGVQNNSLTNDEFLKNNYDFFDKLIRNINDDKKSTTKTINEISIEEFKKFILNYIDQNRSCIQNISVSEFKNKVEKNILEIFAKFKQEIRKFIKDTKDANIEAKRNFKKEIKTEYVSSGIHGKFVNIISGEENSNSKLLGIQYNKLMSSLSKTKEVKKIVNENIRFYQTIIRNLDGAITLSTAGSVVFGILGFIYPPFWIGGFATGIISEGLSIARAIMVKKLNYEFIRLEAYNEIIKGLEKSENNVGSSVWTHISGLILNPHINVANGIVNSNLKIWSGAKAASNALGSVGLIVSGIDLALSANDWHESNLKLDQIETFDNELMSNIEEMNKLLLSYRNKGVKWVVINETRQTDLYQNGGRGGLNLEFKNIHEDKIYTLNELLSYDSSLLYLWGLSKVYNSKLKVWYIRTLPNNTMLDNLE